MAVPCPPALGACISTNNDSALGGEPMALHCVLCKLQPILLQVRQSFVADFDIAIPTMGLWERSIQVCKVEMPKGQGISARLQVAYHLCQLTFADPPSVLLQMAQQVFAQLCNLLQFAARQCNNVLRAVK